MGERKVLPFRLFKNRRSGPPASEAEPILPFEEQVRAWRRVSRRLGLAIPAADFNRIPSPAAPTEVEKAVGFLGTVLCYGFGDDGRGGSDPVLSGRLAWEYAKKRRRGRTWQCDYVDFGRPGRVRLRPEAPPRPKGFYQVKLNPGRDFLHWPVRRFRQKLDDGTGLGPEGLQLIAVTNPHLAELMNERKMNFMALADYDVAPHGFDDFCEAPQIFCSQGILGLGVGNLDGEYPLFGIPVIKF